MTNNWPVPILIDKRNFATFKDSLIECMSGEMIGIDLETEDSNRHEGLNILMAIKDSEENSKGSTKKLLFDINRTKICGISLYKDGDGHAFYINLNHADVANRLDFHNDIEPILNTKKESAYWAAHNAVFERVMLMACYGYDLGPNVLCTMYLAVACFGADEYDMNDFLAPGLRGIEKLFPEIIRTFALYQPGDKDLTNEQMELLNKVTAKESKADHSYNGFVSEIAYGHGLKNLTLKFLNYKQSTFAETLGDSVHMGQLTGEEVSAYGADDAWCAVWLYHKLIEYALEKNPSCIPLYFEVDNPMTEVYADVWLGGLKVNHAAIMGRRDTERANYAKTLRTLKEAVQALLPFPTEYHEKLMKYDVRWYGKDGGAAKYRKKILDWAMSPDGDDVTVAQQVRGSVSNLWASDLGLREPQTVSISHYMPARTLLYDLCGLSYMMSNGKTQSDKDTQVLLLERWEKKNTKEGIDPVRYQAVKTVLASYKELARIDNVMKLFVQKYLLLTDPDTGKMYPIMSATLATRRMSMNDPNAQQLSKFGESAYVRGFFEPDEEDHLIVSNDWSSVELVVAGEKSQDATFLDMYRQRPYKDLHRVTAASVMDMSLEELAAHPDAKELRTDVGKGTNFSVIYSGNLNSTAQKMGWSSDEMWERTEKFWSNYQGLKSWRDGVIIHGREFGFSEVGNGHRRVRFEATYQWQNFMKQKWAATGNPTLKAFGDLMVKKITNRASNQLINAEIQGFCAELLKKANLKQRRTLRDLRVRLMVDIHDEVVYSCHKDDVIAFLPRLYQTMIDHPDMVKHVVLDSSAAIGLTLEPYHPVRAPIGQIELNEMNKGLPCIPEDRWEKKATQEEIQIIIDYLFAKRKEMRNEKAAA